MTGNSLKVYVGVEYPPEILEYNSSSTVAPSSTAHSWVLAFPAGTVTASNGMEGMTWVPNGDHPYVSSGSGGVFFASSQKNGTIYVFDVDLASVHGTPVLRGSFTPDSTRPTSPISTTRRRPSSSTCSMTPPTSCGRST